MRVQGFKGPADQGKLVLSSSRILAFSTLQTQEISIIEDTLINRKLSFKLELEKQKQNEYQKLITKLKLSNISLSPKEK
jgi:hypothetical protein